MAKGKWKGCADAAGRLRGDYALSKVTVNELTDELLEIADALEEHGVNVELEGGGYLNPVASIRGKVDAIWQEVLAMEHDMTEFLSALAEAGSAE